mgnify:CR=1 FL=1
MCQEKTDRFRIAVFRMTRIIILGYYTPSVVDWQRFACSSPVKNCYCSHALVVNYPSSEMHIPVTQ